MDSTKGANPFLMDDYSSPPSNNSNPFLMEDNDFPSETGFCDNPFLSQAPATVPVDHSTSVAPANNATNPFAFDPMDYAPAEATPAEEMHSTLPMQPNDLFGASVTADYAQPTIVQNITSTAATDFFSMDNNEADELPTTMPPVTPFPTPVIQKPAALNLKHTHTITRVEDTTNLYSSDEELSKIAPPRRPPPPRPAPVPPSKETQDLIMSVTGAMDATSSHLLDRIPPTRTPSPVSMRDLHSPSPTPEHAFADFLDVGMHNKVQSAAPIQSNTDTIDFFDVNDCDDTPINIPNQDEQIKPEVVNTTDPFMSLMSNTPQMCDINQNHSTIAKPTPEVPVRPPRPQPPQKPPPPAFRPAPPAIPPQPSTVVKKIAPPQDDMMDMFGQTDLPQPPPQPAVEKPVASTADIMSLYSSAPPVTARPVILAQPAEPVVVDFLGESIATVTATTIATATTTETNTPVIQDAFVISPEQSQHDIHMDTSDTQSKGSASSVTFNPFASEEPVVSSMIDTTATTPEQIENDHFVLDSSPFANQTEPTPLSNSTNTKNENDSIFGQPQPKDDFDDFAAKFESAAKDETKNGFDPFGASVGGLGFGDGGTNNNSSAWGNLEEDKGFSGGFDADEPFDAFLSLQEPPAPPQGTPSMLSKRESQESDDDKDFSIVIKPKNEDDFLRTSNTAMPVLAPPPKSPVQNSAFSDTPRLNPFDQQTGIVSAIDDQIGIMPTDIPQFQRTDSQETPPTPLFDDDVSQPLEDYPRVTWAEEGWEMQLRQPNKKKITGQRFWKKIFVKLIMHEDVPILQLFNTTTDKDAFQELPLQPCYSVSDIGAQQYDNYGKIFTVKLQYIFYKERPGVRPGQVTKAERITNKLSQFAAYAIQGDYQGVKEFGSDLKKLGLPVEHAPQVSQLLKLGSLNFEDMKQFSVTIEEALFHLSAHRDRALHYKMEEVQVTAVDELYVEQNAEGFVEKQIARVRLFFLGFLSGMPDVELGVNDMRRQGKEVVGRHDIIPVVTEEWIRLEAVEFAACVQQDEYHNTHIIKFKPPDACYIELMRFRIRPPKNRELPLQLKPVMCITGNKVEIRADCLVPGFASRKLGQVPCEDVMIRIPIPECWIYLFRVEKHFRYGSVKSTHRRTGKVKGIERFLGTVETLQESLIEVTSGQAKYEHQHRAIVWRIPRLPKEGQGAYTTHNLVCRLALTSYDQVPDQLADYCYVEFTMPATQASHTTVRSVSLQNSQSDDPPEKYVRYLARHEYRVGIEHTEGEDPNPYAAATATSRTPAPVPEEPTPPPLAAIVADPDSSSDSD